MDFAFTAEQEQLREQVRRFLDTECPLERVRDLMLAKTPHDPGLWKKIADLGWLALTIPEDFGGLGLGWEEVVVISEEMGKTVFPSPFLANTLAAQAILTLGDKAQKERLLPGLADGSVIGTLAVLEESDRLDADGVQTKAAAQGGAVVLTGEKLFVADTEAAGLFLVAAREAGGVSLFAVPRGAEGLATEPLAQFDATKRVGVVRLDGVRVEAADRLGAAGKAWEGISRVLDKGLIAFAAETVGAAQAALNLAVHYAKIREQFGTPIGRFQGVKHPCAEMHVEIESARSLAYYGGWVVDNDPAKASRYASMAKAAASEAADRAGEECIQIHGAIGFTWECDAHLYYKRGRYALLAQGSPDHHYDRVLSVQGL